MPNMSDTQMSDYKGPKRVASKSPQRGGRKRGKPSDTVVEHTVIPPESTQLPVSPPMSGGGVPESPPTSGGGVPESPPTSGGGYTRIPPRTVLNLEQALAVLNNIQPREPPTGNAVISPAHIEAERLRREQAARDEAEQTRREQAASEQARREQAEKDEAERREQTAKDEAERLEKERADRDKKEQEEKEKEKTKSKTNEISLKHKMILLMLVMIVFSFGVSELKTYFFGEGFTAPLNGFKGNGLGLDPRMNADILSLKNTTKSQPNVENVTKEKSERREYPQPPVIRDDAVQAVDTSSKSQDTTLIKSDKGKKTRSEKNLKSSTKKAPEETTNAKPVKTPADAKPAKIPADAKPVETPADAKPVEIPQTPADAKPVEIPQTPADAKPAKIPQTPVDAKPVQIPQTPADAKPVQIPETPADAKPVETLLTPGSDDENTTMPRTPKVFSPRNGKMFDVIFQKLAMHGQEVLVSGWYWDFYNQQIADPENEFIPIVSYWVNSTMNTFHCCMEARMGSMKQCGLSLKYWPFWNSVPTDYPREIHFRGSAVYNESVDEPYL